MHMHACRNLRTKYLDFAEVGRLNRKRQSHPRFECLPAMCYNLCIVPESLGYSLGLSEIWRL